MTEAVKEQLNAIYEKLYHNFDITNEEALELIEQISKIKEDNNISSEEEWKYHTLYNIKRATNLPEGMDITYEDTEVDGKKAITLKLVKVN